MAEWPIAPILGTDKSLWVFAGSNPDVSAYHPSYTTDGNGHR